MPITHSDLEHIVTEFSSMIREETWRRIGAEWSAVIDCQATMDDSNNMIPWSDGQGLYNFLDVHDHVLYVGSTTRSFGTRFWDHADKIRVGEGRWPEAVRFRMYRFKESPCLARALEALILERHVSALPLNKMR